MPLLKLNQELMLQVIHNLYMVKDNKYILYDYRNSKTISDNYQNYELINNNYIIVTLKTKKGIIDRVCHTKGLCWSR